MSVLSDFPGLLAQAFGTTLSLSVLSWVLALIVGVALGVARLSPLPILRAAGGFYVETVRNTPLTVVFFIVVFVLPQIDVHFPSYFWCAVAALGFYTAAFVCEAVRAGVSTVGRGQAEAARALGVPFSLSMRSVILPQALRAVVPPMANVWIALVKNSSIAAGFGVLELSAAGQRINFLAPSQVLPALVWIVVAYLVITLSSAAVFRLIERKAVSA